MKKLAVLYFSDFHTWPVGGMLQYLLNILSKLSENFEMTIFGCSMNGVEPKPLVIKNKVYPIQVMGNIKTEHKIIPNYIKYLYYTRKIAKHIHSMNFDILYFHASPIIYAYGKSVKNETAVLAYHQHGLSTQNKFYAYFQNWSMKHADVCFINAGQQDILKKEQELEVPGGSFIRAPGQVDIRVFKKYGYKACTPNFCYSGRITDWKQPQLLVEALAYIQQSKYPQARLTLIGDGDQTEKVRKLAADLQVDKAVDITGYVSRQQVVQYLNKATIFVMPTKGEGNSLSVLEAMACELPVVCFDVIGMRDVVVDGYNGCVANHMTRECLGDAMIRAYEGAESLANNALKTAEEYSVDKVCEIIITSLNRAVNKN